MGQVRIIGGIHRSRKLYFKDNQIGLRPTPDRVRETVFNWLGQTLTNKNCLDLFAGSGAMGFEAVSRNANSVVMVESNRRVYDDLIINSELLKLSNLTIYNQDALEFLKRNKLDFDIIFIDPPYNSHLLEKILNILKQNQMLNTLIYIEYQNEPELTGYEVIRKSKAGVVHYALLRLDKSNLTA